MPAPLDVSTFQEIRFRMPQRIARRALGTSSLPVFAPANAAALQSGAIAVSEDGRKWSGLKGWLGGAGPAVLCQRAQLTFPITAKAPADVVLLPPTAEPTARLNWESGTETKTEPLRVALDLAQRTFSLALPFADTSEGLDKYSQLLVALSSNESNCRVVLACQHSFLTRVPAPQPTTPTGRPGNVVIRDHRRDVIVAQPNLSRPMVLRDHRMVRPQAMEPVHAQAMVFDREAILRSRNFRTTTVYVAPPAEPTLEPGTMTEEVVFPVMRPQSDAAAFPDLARSANHGWGQVPGRDESKPRLLFRDSPEVDSFFYLPTAFKLGFGKDETATRPPMRAEIYLDEQDRHRVRVTLVALPYIDEHDRNALRKYLLSTVLGGAIDLVRLSLTAGLKASFEGDFAWGDGTVNLPTNIKFTQLAVMPDKWVRMQFDMEAGSYPIFCELLRKKIRGSVQVGSEDVQYSIPVVLDLEDVISDAVQITPNASDPLDLSVDNSIGWPVTLSSLHATLLDATDVPGVTFDIEEQDLLPADGYRVEKGGRWTGKISPQQIGGWDERVLSLGPVRVDIGTPQNWLDHVNRDQSLTPPPLRIRVTLSVPAFAAAGVELVQVRVRRDGEQAPRQEVRLLPGSAATELSIALSLAELASGTSTGLFLEYETLQKDGRLSLSQRQAIRPTEREVVLIALVNGDDLAYTIDSVIGDLSAREELDHPLLVTKVQELSQAAGARWQIYARKKDAPSTPATTPTTPTTPQGPEIQLLGDLIGPALTAGTVKKVIVVLQPTAPGAASSTIVLEPGQAASRGWRPLSGTVPPFAYTLTYILPDGASRKVQGVEDGSSLLIDWPLP